MAIGCSIFLRFNLSFESTVKFVNIGSKRVRYLLFLQRLYRTFSTMRAAVNRRLSYEGSERVSTKGYVFCACPGSRLCSCPPPLLGGVLLLDVKLKFFD